MKRTCAILCGLSFAWTSLLYAGDTISNYSCDFEDEVQNLTWHFPVNNSVPHHWTIGQATNNGGRHAMYVTPNGLDTTTYINSSAIVYVICHFCVLFLMNSSDGFLFCPAVSE